MLQKIVTRISSIILTKFYSFFQNSFKHTGEAIQLEIATVHKEISFAESVGKWAGKGYIFTNNGFINTAGVTTANYKNRTQFLPIGTFLKWVIVYKILKKKPKPISQSVFMPPQMWSSNFYHWMVEILPAIWYVYQHTDLKIAISDLSQMNKNTFIQLLPQSDPTRFVAASKLSSFNKFITISNIRIQRNGAVSLPNPLLLTCYKRKRKKVQTPCDVLLISRQFSGNRMIINEESLAEELRKQGFVVSILYPEKNDFLVQLQCLEDAKIIIGPHGAGLTNIVFAIHTSMLIEITGPKEINGSFSTLAESLEVGYQLVHAEYAKQKISIADKLSPTRKNLFLSKASKIEICSIVSGQMKELHLT